MAGRRNECPNPSCINNTTGIHNFSGTATRVTGQTGPPRSTAAQISSPAAAYSDYLGSAGTAASSGQTWSGVTWLWHSAARAIDVMLIGWTGASADNNSVTDLTRVNLAASTWTQVQLTGTVTGSFTEVAVLCDFPTTGTSGQTFRLGSTRLERVSDAALTYADGDTAGWGWGGTAGSSTSGEVPSLAPPMLNPRRRRQHLLVR